MSPLRIDEEAFALAVGRPSSRWGHASARLPYSTPLDVAVARLAQACCACVVTSLPGTGASLALKYRKSGSSGNGKTKVYLLAKGGRSGRELVVDVKCMDASAVDSTRIVADVVHALSSLSL
jgi:hypothetical protein